MGIITLIIMMMMTTATAISTYRPTEKGKQLNYHHYHRQQKLRNYTILISRVVLYRTFMFAGKKMRDSFRFDISSCGCGG